MRSPASRRRGRCPITSPISSAPFRRAIVLVMDSVGIGELPDAAAYGDQGSNTVGNIAKRIPLSVPTLRALGLGRVAALGSPPSRPPVTSVPAAADLRPGGASPPSPAAMGRMAEASAG